MIDLAEILRELANEPEWMSLGGKITDGICNPAFSAAGLVNEHNRLVAKNRALVEALEMGVRGFYRQQACSVMGRYNKIGIETMDAIAAKLAAALEDGK